jgi:hypothetical protein
VRPPYPIEIPPLLPIFLNKRRAKITYPLEKTDELGIDRPTFIWVVNLSYRGDRGGTGEPGDLMSAYSTIPDRWMPMAAAARGAGLAEERDGRWHLTAKGRDLAVGMHKAARDHYATLTPIPKKDLAELARLLDRAFLVAAEASEPARRQHTPFAFGYRGDDPEPGSFAQLDAAVYGLWQVRDDAHMAAWRASRLSGPEVELLTRIWRNEAADVEALRELLPHQSPESIDQGLVRLRREGLVAKEDLAVTERGVAARQAIEDETDRLFFSPWPDDVGARSGWIAEKLTEVNTALT